MASTMKYERKANDRGAANFGWLDSRHTFSFGSYYDPHHMGFGNLRVINDDKIAPRGGFDTHGHQNMEIISYGIEGALSHKDSMGHEYVIREGDVQIMSAGTGVEHSEFNPSSTEVTHFLQIWILPDKNGHTPRYQQKHFSLDSRKNQWRHLVSGSGAEQALAIHQDVEIYSTILEPEKSIDYSLESGRLLWIHVAKGEVVIDGVHYEAGDGVGFEGEKYYEFVAKKTADIVIFDLGK